MMAMKTTMTAEGAKQLRFPPYSILGYEWTT